MSVVAPEPVGRDRQALARTLAELEQLIRLERRRILAPWRMRSRHARRARLRALRIMAREVRAGLALLDPPAPRTPPRRRRSPFRCWG